MAAFWAASVVQDLGAATGIKTAAVLFLRSAGSSPSSHLVRSTIRRYYIARSLAEYLADDQLSRLHLHDTTLAANLVKGLVPYLLLLMHFFETYRARVANFIKDPDNADYFNGNTARRPMQSPIIETDILKGLYRQENISHLYTVYTWLLKILDWKRSYGSSITNYQEIFLLCGLEPVRDAIRISYGRSRKAYVEAQIQLAKQGSTPSGSLLTVLDIATAKTLIRMSHGSAGFPSIRNRIALGLPRRQDKEDMDLQTTRDGFLAVLESRDWAEQDLLV